MTTTVEEINQLLDTLPKNTRELLEHMKEQVTRAELKVMEQDIDSILRDLQTGSKTLDNTVDESYRVLNQVKAHIKKIEDMFDQRKDGVDPVKAFRDKLRFPGTNQAQAANRIDENSIRRLTQRK